MKPKQQDKLFDIFKHRLNQIDPESQSVQDLIYDVVGDYMAYLMAVGNIPDHMLDTLENDLKEEVMEMYRKTTYGFLTLKDYKSAKNVKKSRVS